VKHSEGLSAEARDEAVDLCAAAVEKHPGDVERCMQVRRGSSNVERLAVLRRPPTRAIPPDALSPSPPPSIKNKTIKEALDRRFGGRWHAVAGRGFAFAVTHQELLHVYVGGSVGVLAWKL
jgi:hypothetical protein